MSVSWTILFLKVYLPIMPGFPDSLNLKHFRDCYCPGTSITSSEAVIISGGCVDDGIPYSCEKVYNVGYVCNRQDRVHQNPYNFLDIEPPYFAFDRGCNFRRNCSGKSL
jgi:hypothetical protein